MPRRCFLLIGSAEWAILSAMQNSRKPRESSGPAYPISSVDNALRLLRLFQEARSVRLTEACAHLGVAHSTAHRLLAMLMHHGFVRRDPRTRAYEPGPALMEIGLAVVQKMDIRTQARPLLEELAGQVQETVHLVTLEGNEVRFLDAVEGNRAVRVAPRTGTLLPAHCTSAGKVLLAELSAERLAAIYGDPDHLPMQTPKSISTLSALRPVLGQVRKSGYATNMEEGEEGVGSAAMALRDKSGTVVAAVAVAVPTSRFDPKRRSRILETLRQLVAQRIPL